MATLRDIRNRIKAVKSTQKITKAMKMVAAAKLRRSQDAIVNARPYARRISDLMKRLIIATGNFEHELVKERDVKNVAVLIVTSDKGLCGSFNPNVLKETEAFLHDNYQNYIQSQNVKYFIVGKKGNDAYSYQSYPVNKKYVGVFSPHLEHRTAQDILNDLQSGYLNEEFDKLFVIYNEFKNVIQQKVVCEQLLPIPITETDLKEMKNVEYIYEPNKLAILESTVPQFLVSQIWRVLLESQAAFYAAQMSAMDNATENASELITQLELSYNRARQASITTELLDIVSGANALNG